MKRNEKRKGNGKGSQEKVKFLKATLDVISGAQNSEASMERLLLELMLWAYGKMDGLLDKARQIRERIAKVKVDKLYDIEVCFLYPSYNFLR